MNIGRYFFILFFISLGLNFLLFHSYLDKDFDLDDDFRYLCFAKDNGPFSPQWLLEKQGRPLSQGLYFSVFWRIFGANPQYYRLINLILHGLFCAFSGILAGKLANSARAGFFVAIICSAHHGLAEIISDVTCITEAALGLPFILSIIFWMEEKNKMAMLFWILALGMKQTALMAPFVAALVLYLMGKEDRLGGKRTMLVEIKDRLGGKRTMLGEIKDRLGGKRTMLGGDFWRPIFLVVLIYIGYSFFVTSFGRSLAGGLELEKKCFFDDISSVKAEKYAMALMNLESFSLNGNMTRAILRTNPAFFLIMGLILALGIASISRARKMVILGLMLIFGTTAPLALFIDLSVRHLYLAIAGYAMVISGLLLIFDSWFKNKSILLRTMSNALVFTAFFSTWGSMMDHIYFNETQKFSSRLRNIISDNSESLENGDCVLFISDSKLEKRYGGMEFFEERVQYAIRVFWGELEIATKGNKEDNSSVILLLPK